MRDPGQGRARGKGLADKTRDLRSTTWLGPMIGHNRKDISRVQSFDSEYAG